MSIASEINRLQTAKADLKTAIEGKGVSVPASAKLDAYPALVDSIEQGGGGDTDDIWYLLCGGDYAEGYVVQNITCLYPRGDSGFYDIYGQAGDIPARYRYICFEYKGERYYIDNGNDGNHTLSKQGSPVRYPGKFMTLSIKKNGNDYVFYCMED